MGFARGFCTLMGSRLVDGVTRMGFLHEDLHTYRVQDGICTGIWLIGSQVWGLHRDLHTYGLQVGICTLIESECWDLHWDLHTYRGPGFGFAHLWGRKDGICTRICALTGPRMGFAHL